MVFNELIAAKLLPKQEPVVALLAQVAQVLKCPSLYDFNPLDMTDDQINAVYNLTTSQNPEYLEIEQIHQLTPRTLEVYIWYVVALTINNTLHKQTVKNQELPNGHPDRSTQYPDMSDHISLIDKVLGMKGVRVYGPSVMDVFQGPFRPESISKLPAGHLPDYRDQLIEMCTRFPHVSRIIAESIVDPTNPGELRMLVVKVIMPTLQDLDFALRLHDEIIAVNKDDEVAVHALSLRILNTINSGWKGTIMEIIIYPEYLLVDKLVLMPVRLIISGMPMSAMLAITPSGKNVGIFPSRRTVSDGAVSKVQDFVTFVAEHGADYLKNARGMLQKFTGGAIGGAGPANA